MQVSFTTLACPGWDLATVLRKARQYGFSGIDFRGIGATLDTTQLPEFTHGIAKTRAMIADFGLEVSGISSSINICDESKLKANVDEAKRTMTLAMELSCPNIRVFGGGDVPTIGREACAKAGVRCLKEILRLDGACWLNWLFETHDHWTRGEDCKFLLDQVAVPAVGVLWDFMHAPRFNNEAPEVTFAAIGERVRYTHIKDGICDPAHPKAMKDGWRYVPPGEGQMPLKQAMKLLKDRGYDGWLVLEHEKRWHPELDDPDQILPKFSAWAKATWKSL